MKLTTEIAQPIVKQLMSFMKYNINIMDENGVIVASGDISRMNKMHEGALKALEAKKEVIITQEQSRNLSGSKPGVNLLIEFHNEIVGVVGITGNPNELEDFARVVKMSVEVLINQIHLNNQMQYHIRAIEGWILDLVNPQVFEENKLDAIARSLNIDISTSRSILLIRVEDLIHSNLEMFNQSNNFQKTNQLRERLQNKIKVLLHRQAIYSFIHNEYFVLLVPFNGKPRVEEKQLSHKIAGQLEEMGLSYLISISKRSSGIQGYRDSFFDALQSLELQQKMGSNADIVHFEDWGVIAAYNNIPKDVRTELVNNYLPSELSEELEESLMAFLDCDLHIKKAADKLHIHHNTLVYRLEKISHQLGMDPRKYTDAVILQLVHICKKLNK